MIEHALAVQAIVSNAAPIKVAQAGAQMFRRADVRGAVLKLRSFNLAAMNQAKNEGREDDAFLHLSKIRSLSAVLIEIDKKCAVFINAQAIEARAPDAPNPCSTPTTGGDER